MIGYSLKIVISLKNTGGDYYDNNSLGTIKILTIFRKNKEIFKRHARELDHRMRLEDAVSLAAEIGEVDILEQLLDHMKSDKEIGDDAQKNPEIRFLRISHEGYRPLYATLVNT